MSPSWSHSFPYKVVSLFLSPRPPNEPVVPKLRAHWALPGGGHPATQPNRPPGTKPTALVCADPGAEPLPPPSVASKLEAQPFAPTRQRPPQDGGPPSSTRYRIPGPHLRSSQPRSPAARAAAAKGAAFQSPGSPQPSLPGATSCATAPSSAVLAAAGLAAELLPESHNVLDTQVMGGGRRDIEGMREGPSIPDNPCPPKDRVAGGQVMGGENRGQSQPFC